MILEALLIWQLIGFAVEAIVIPPAVIKYMKGKRDAHFEQAAERARETTRKAEMTDSFCGTISKDVERFYVRMADLAGLEKQVYAEKERLNQNLFVKMSRNKYAEIVQDLGLAPPLLEEVDGNKYDRKLYGANVVFDEESEKPSIETD